MIKRGDFVWGLAFCVVSSIFLIQGSREVVMVFTGNHHYVAAFIKFAVLSTMGELLAIRLGGRSWRKPPGIILRGIVWGAIGIVVTLMFAVFGAGVKAAIAGGMLWAGGNLFPRFGTAFMISVVMNLVFAPVFMIGHRLTDTWIDLKFGEKVYKISLNTVLDKVDWTGLMGFVVFKTIPFFWIPAHTITFLIPGEYRILFAAYLSIALGIILGIAKGKGAKNPEHIV